ncbi:hypothetical protein C0992_004142 [Termitomyces sp. T32_za158]|nr:hypothetical protein C0992_004142 [Termitomyces sp. T32_za158]
MNQNRESRMEKAVRESREAAERVRQSRVDRKAAENELQQDPQLDEVELEPDIDQVLSAMNAGTDAPYIMPGADLDAPRTWEEAQNCADKERWTESYEEELKSLKEMGVWTLVP